MFLFYLCLPHINFPHGCADVQVAIVSDCKLRNDHFVSYDGEDSSIIIEENGEDRPIHTQPLHTVTAVVQEKQRSCQGSNNNGNNNNNNNSNKSIEVWLHGLH